MFRKDIDLNWMMNCFCGMADRRKAFSLISSRDHGQRSSPSQISNTPWAGFEPAQSLSSGLVEWRCAVVITTTPRCRSWYGIIGLIDTAWHNWHYTMAQLAWSPFSILLRFGAGSPREVLNNSYSKKYQKRIQSTVKHVRLNVLRK